MLLLKFLLKFLKILNKDATPSQIAAGLALGSIAGITPLASLHNLFLLVLIMVIRVNFSAAILGMALFKIFSFLLDPIFNKIGYFLLVDVTALKPLWTSLYNTPIVPWFQFNNTLTLGSFIFSLFSFWPVYLLFVWLVKTYREKILVRIQKWKFVQFLKASKWYGIYNSYE